MNYLSHKSLAGNSSVPFLPEDRFSLPEKILQFGTGVLLRALPDYFVETANRQGIFNGRIVVVKSTDRGDGAAFARQDNLYTLCTRALSRGKIVEKNQVCSAISRVLSARDQWPDILACAADPRIVAVISNTTEAGLQPVEEKIGPTPPVSFPGKLLAVLQARYRAFSGDPAMGWVIVPTELIPDNGPLLKNILTGLARYNQLEPAFIHWLETANTFCSSLVDQIVPGYPGPEAAAKIEAQLGYRDDLMALCEDYRLWAIEGDEKVREVLSFYQADPGMVIEPDIAVYRELKLRMLNAPHTLCCGLAHLCGIGTVKAGMVDPDLNAYIQRLMMDEIALAIPHPVDAGRVRAYGLEVLDRFANPFLEHRWLNITLQYTVKMRMRVAPVLLEYYQRYNRTPEAIALGFAAWLHFILPKETTKGQYFGLRQGEPYLIDDQYAGYLMEQTAGRSPNQIPGIVLSDSKLWGQDLTGLPRFAERVAHYYLGMQENGARKTLSNFAH